MAFLRLGVVSVASINEADLPALSAWMVQLRDRPMDFPDATLVHLAERESLTSVFTVDHDDFETYGSARGAGSESSRRAGTTAPERGRPC